MQRQGRMRFLKTFPANFSFSLLPLAHKTWTQATSHTLPPLMQAMTGHLTRRHGSGKVPLSSCGYKYREGRRQRRGGEKRKKRKRRGGDDFLRKRGTKGGKILEKKRRVDKQRGEDLS
jgi:hypothetical protein